MTSQYHLAAESRPRYLPVSFSSWDLPASRSIFRHFLWLHQGQILWQGPLRLIESIAVGVHTQLGAEIK